MYPTDKFIYKYLAGPVQTPEAIEAGVTEGNCRFALQLYFYRQNKKFFEKDEIYLPGGYKMLGEFIFKEEPIDFAKLVAGDVIYAQNLRNKEDKEVDKSLERYGDKDEWLYYLHSAIYIGEINDGTETRYIWHATHIDGGPTLWTLEKFERYYKPISAKRVTWSAQFGKLLHVLLDTSGVLTPSNIVRELGSMADQAPCIDARVSSCKIGQAGCSSPRLHFWF